MAKKTWIKLKRGLLSRQHRATMSECIWLYLFLLDTCDWESGIVFAYTDRDASEQLAIPLETIRKQRRRLEKEEYISCDYKGQYQNITIHKWTNPRKYDGEIINDPDIGVVMDGHSDHGRPPLDDEGVAMEDHCGHEGGHDLIGGVATLPLISESHITSDEDSLEKIWEKVRYATKLTTGVISPNSKIFKYIDATQLVSLSDGKAIVRCLMPSESDQPAWLEDRVKNIFENSFIGVLAKRIEVQFVGRDDQPKQE